jgi:hypothetical protein
MKRSFHNKNFEKLYNLQIICPNFIKMMYRMVRLIIRAAYYTFCGSGATDVDWMA